MNPTFARALGVERLSVVSLKVVEAKTARAPEAARSSVHSSANLSRKVAVR